jgi:hypothetical protein
MTATDRFRHRVDDVRSAPFPCAHDGTPSEFGTTGCLLPGVVDSGQQPQAIGRNRVAVLVRSRHGVS